MSWSARKLWCASLGIAAIAAGNSLFQAADLAGREPESRVAAKTKFPVRETPSVDVPPPLDTTISDDGDSSAPGELTPQLVELRAKVREALASYYPKRLSARDNTPWEIMHGIIA